MRGNLLRSILDDWMEIRQADSTQRWRGQLLSLFLLGSLLIGVLLFLVNGFLWIRTTDPDQFRFVFVNAFAIVAISALWFINRRGWNRAASIAFILLASFLPFLSVPTAGYERVLIIAAVPITFSAFLFGPAGSFLAMCVQVALYTWIYLQSGSPLGYNYFAMVAMFLLAFTAWVCATWFESTLAQAHASQERLRMITENMVDVIGHINTKSILLYASPSVRKMFGWDPAELMGCSVLDNIHPEESETVLKQVQAAVAQHLPTIRQEFRYRCANGTYKWIESETRLMYDPSGTFDSAVFGIRDISRRRDVEEEILRLNAELERRVEERTAQLEAANKELEAFSYSVSHDLRAPLRSIDGFSQALQEDYGAHLDEQGLDFLRRIRSASQRMGLLIDDLLQLSRLTRGDLNRKRLNLSTIARRVLEEHQRAEPGRKVEWKVAENLTASADERLLAAVLENLLGNAWKFTLRRKEAKIEFGAFIAPKGERAFFVKDNGAGFDMQHVEKLFHAFQRLHTVQEFPGNGIGLATVQRIIHRHGGRVWAEGEPEKGAVFYFTLPE